MGCEDSVFRQIRAQCELDYPDLARIKACRAGLDFAKAQWRSDWIEHPPGKTVLNEATLQALNLCRDEYRGGIQRMNERRACESAVRSLREMAYTPISSESFAPLDPPRSEDSSRSKSNRLRKNEGSLDVDRKDWRDFQDSFRGGRRKSGRAN